MFLVGGRDHVCSEQIFGDGSGVSWGQWIVEGSILPSLEDVFLEDAHVWALKYPQPLQPSFTKLVLW